MGWRISGTGPGKSHGFCWRNRSKTGFIDIYCKQSIITYYNYICCVHDIYIYFTVYGSVGSKPFVSCIPFVHDLALLTLFLDKSDNYHFSHLSHFYDWQWNSSWYLDVHLSWYLGNSYDSYGSYDLFTHWFLRFSSSTYQTFFTAHSIVSFVYLWVTYPCSSVVIWFPILFGINR